MANFLQKIFLSEPKWRTLDAISHHTIIHVFTRWTKPCKNGSEDYKCSKRSFSINAGDISIISSQHYDEQLAHPDNPYALIESPVHVSLDVVANCDGAQQELHEYDTNFAYRVYEKMMREHEKRNSTKTTTKVR